MTTRAQDTVIDHLALSHGRVSVRDGFADGYVRVTVPNGTEVRISPEGHIREAGYNFSINWNE